MDDNEYTSLLRHLRQRTIQAGLGSLDQRAMERASVEPGMLARFKVDQYLRALDAEVRLRSDDLVSRVLAGLNAQVDRYADDSAQPIDRLIVELADDDRSNEGESEIRLVGTDGLALLTRQIAELRAAIAEDEDGLEPPPLQAGI